MGFGFSDVDTVLVGCNFGFSPLLGLFDVCFRYSSIGNGGRKTDWNLELKREEKNVLV